MRNRKTTWKNLVVAALIGASIMHIATAGLIGWAITKQKGEFIMEYVPHYLAWPYHIYDYGKNGRQD